MLTIKRSTLTQSGEFVDDQGKLCILGHVLHSLGGVPLDVFDCGADSIHRWCNTLPGKEHLFRLTLEGNYVFNSFALEVTKRNDSGDFDAAAALLTEVGIPVQVGDDDYADSTEDGKKE